jgi:hypothetical protein
MIVRLIHSCTYYNSDHCSAAALACSSLCVQATYACNHHLHIAHIDTLLLPVQQIPLRANANKLSYEHLDVKNVNKL